MQIDFTAQYSQPLILVHQALVFQKLFSDEKEADSSRSDAELRNLKDALNEVSLGPKDMGPVNITRRGSNLRISLSDDSSEQLEGDESQQSGPLLEDVYATASEPPSNDSSTTAVAENLHSDVNSFTPSVGARLQGSDFIFLKGHFVSPANVHSLFSLEDKAPNNVPNSSIGVGILELKLSSPDLSKLLDSTSNKSNNTTASPDMSTGMTPSTRRRIHTWRLDWTANPMEADDAISSINKYLASHGPNIVSVNRVPIQVTCHPYQNNH
ncbi:hypothetical protein Aperf_G00000097742 [Anoplocephala perfoliata]